MDIHSARELRGGGRIPVIGLGTWQLTDDTAGTVAEALRLGYRMIDTAVDYGTQPAIGEAIAASGIDRGDLYISTKVEEDEDAYAGTRRDLDELGLESVDLMLIHRPPRHGSGIEVWEGLLRARDEGLTRDIGVSNYTIDQIDDLIEATGEAPAVNQIEWSPLGWSGEMLSYCRSFDIVIEAYSPLTHGTRLADERLQTAARAHGKTAAQLLLRWDVERGVVPIPKANDRAHLAENLDVFDFELTASEVERLGALNERYSALGRLAYA